MLEIPIFAMIECFHWMYCRYVEIFQRRCTVSLKSADMG